MTDVYFVKAQRARPPQACLAYFLWGNNSQFKLDGNAASPTDCTWTHLTLINQDDRQAQVDIKPASIEPLMFEIKGTPVILAARAAYYLGMSIGQVAHSLSGPFFEPESLEPELGDFDIEAALWNAAGI